MNGNKGRLKYTLINDPVTRDSARSEVTNDAGEEAKQRDSIDSKKYIPFLNTSWPGSILDWSDRDLEKFAECFTPHNVKVGEEVSKKRNSLLVEMQSQKLKTSFFRRV